MKKILAIALAAFLTMGVANCEPAVEPAPGVIEIVDVESTVIEMINQYRVGEGLPALTWHGSLHTAAQGHSNWMANVQTMSHEQTPGAFNGGERLTNAGYSWSTWGENIGAGQPTPEDIVGAWMNSPGHRAVIMSPWVTDIAVAVSRGTNEVNYWTMMVAHPK